MHPEIRSWFDNLLLYPISLSYYKGLAAHSWAQTVFLFTIHYVVNMHHKKKRYWDLDALLRLRAFNKVWERAKWLQNVQKMSRKSKMNVLLSLQGCDWCDVGPFNFISLDLKTLWCCHSNETSFAEHLHGTIKMIIMNLAGNFCFDLCYEAK